MTLKSNLIISFKRNKRRDEKNKNEMRKAKLNNYRKIRGDSKCMQIANLITTQILTMSDTLQTVKSAREK
jgi:hypothetical protein